MLIFQLEARCLELKSNICSSFLLYSSTEDDHGHDEEEEGGVTSHDEDEEGGEFIQL